MPWRRRPAEVIAASDVAVVELTDTYREFLIAYASLRHIDTPEEPPRELAAAVKRDDLLLGRILPHVDLENDTLLVLGTSGPGRGHPKLWEWRSWPVWGPNGTAG